MKRLIKMADDPLAYEKQLINELNGELDKLFDELNQIDNSLNGANIKIDDLQAEILDIQDIMNNAQKEKTATVLDIKTLREHRERSERMTAISKEIRELTKKVRVSDAGVDNSNVLREIKNKLDQLQTELKAKVV